MKVIETDRRSARVREESDRQRDSLTSRTTSGSIAEALESLEEQRRAWERGFVAGIEAANARLARGTRDFAPVADEDITAPYPVVDPSELE